MTTAELHAAAVAAAVWIFVCAGNVKLDTVILGPRESSMRASLNCEIVCGVSALTICFNSSAAILCGQLCYPPVLYGEVSIWPMYGWIPVGCSPHKFRGLVVFSMLLVIGCDVVRVVLCQDLVIVAYVLST